MINHSDPYIASPNPLAGIQLLLLLLGVPSVLVHLKREWIPKTVVYMIPCGGPYSPSSTLPLTCPVS